MIEQEKRPENLYKLSLEELTCPSRGKTTWFEQLASRQLEGIEMGFRPQNPRGLGRGLRKKWLTKVWNVYLSGTSFSNEELRIIRRTRGPARGRHTGSSRFCRDEY